MATFVTLMKSMKAMSPSPRATPPPHSQMKVTKKSVPRELPVTALDITGAGPFVSTCIVEAAQGGGLLTEHDGDTVGFGANTKEFLPLIAPRLPPVEALEQLLGQIKATCGVHWWQC